MAGGKKTVPRDYQSAPAWGMIKLFLPLISGSGYVRVKGHYSSTSAGKVGFIYSWLQLLFKMENLKRSELLT